MRKKLVLDEISKLPTFSLHSFFQRHEKVWFFCDIEGPSKAYELDLKDFSYKPFRQDLNLTLLTPFLWLDDDKTLLIARDKEGNEQYDVSIYDDQNNRETKLTDTPNNKEYFVDISPDKNFLLIRSNRNITDNLFKLDLNSKELIQLTFHKNPIYSGCHWSKKDVIFYSARKTENMRNVDIWMIKADGTDNKQLLQLSEDSIDYIADLSQEGDLLLINTNCNGTDQALLYDLDSKEKIWFGSGKFQETPIQLSKDKKSLLVLRDEHVRKYPVIYDIATKEERVPNISGVTYRAQFVGDKYLFYYRSDPRVPTILALYDLDKNEEITIIQPEMEYSTDDFYEPELVKYKTFDGKKINAILYTPELEEDRKYPALVLAPGGPGGRVMWSFFSFAQVAASEGFILISPHIRGSYGYGKEFRDYIFNDIGGGDAKDYVFCKKYLETLEYVDANRIGIFGGSYGGYMTYLQLTKYAEAGWNAGVASVGITSWKTMYDESMPSYQYWIETLFGTYEENEELWEDRSPINFAEKIEAPISMIQAVNDPRCPVQEARQFRDKLLQLNKKEGIDFEYFEIGGEGHVLAGQEARLRDDKMTLEFFKKTLKLTAKDE